MCCLHQRSRIWRSHKSMPNIHHKILIPILTVHIYCSILISNEKIRWYCQGGNGFVVLADLFVYLGGVNVRHIIKHTTHIIEHDSWGWGQFRFKTPAPPPHNFNWLVSTSSNDHLDPVILYIHGPHPSKTPFPFPLRILPAVCINVNQLPRGLSSN